MDAAVERECRAARTGVGMMDASTLGKIEIKGADAGEFLNRIYTNAFKKLAVGSARYGVMCKPDGMMFDDGVTLRLAEDTLLHAPPPPVVRPASWTGWRSGCRPSGPSWTCTAPR